MLWTILQRFSFISHIASELIFLYFSQIQPFGCHDNQSNWEVWTKSIWLEEDHSSNISKKHTSKYLQWTSSKCQFLIFPFISSWKLWVAIVPRIGDGDAENWNRVWVQYGLLFWQTVGTICCFFHSDLPSTHCMTCWKWSSYKHHVCPSVHLFVLP